ncbi:hypothetical protein [Actinopolymorpha rutila]|uniref:Uncharacterized protein n=1 Tax=Actinopolymorpha rutila TaxID=446787 RepID=A0A852ZVT4_9ACTN|nr:hypothetical protein [Actinopolymorpha rutila]NYH93070.1 hypothetical protein [Actinopolymorpha rutila]
MSAAQRRQSDSPALHASATGAVRGGWVTPLTQATSPPGDPGARPTGSAPGPGTGSTAGRTPDHATGASATSPAAASATSSAASEAADPRPLTEREWERLRRRAALLRDLAEAKDLFAVRANQLRRQRKALRRAL